MSDKDMTEGEAINYYKENRPVEEATYYGTIEDYEKDFQKKQEKKEIIKQQEANFAEIMQKGLFKADIKYPNE